MFEEYNKLFNERKKINKKVDKGYKKLIISIIVMALGFALPGFLVGEIPFLMNLFKTIDVLFLKIFGGKAIITPLLYMGLCALGGSGIIANTVKILIGKSKLRDIEYREKEKLLEIKTKIQELTKEKENVKEQIIESNKNKKQILTALKRDIKEKFSIKKGERIEPQNSNQEEMNNVQVKR